jgi:DNA-binding response OmpR family regulator
MHRILFISDDWANKKPLKVELSARGYTLLPVSSSEALTAEFVPPHPLSLLMADLERCASEAGVLCRTLKRQRALKALPLVLLVTEEQLSRLDVHWGMDDYLTLPVSGARLAQRLAFLLWKLTRIEPKNGFSRGELVIDFERYEVRLQREPVDLTYKEFELLKFLVTHPGKPFSREALLDQVWGYDYYGGTRTVDVHIRRLRSKLESRGDTYLETVRNVGYKFVDAGKL